MVGQEDLGGAASPQGGGLFRGAPAYAARTPWKPAEALSVALVIYLVSTWSTRLLGNLADTRPGLVAGIAAWGHIVSPAVMIVLTLGASMLLGGRTRDVLALRRPAGGWRSYANATLLSVLVPVLMGVALLAAMVTASLLGGGESVLQSSLDDFRVLQSFEAQWLLVLVFAPLAEELLFRGFLLSALAPTKLGFWGAALVSTLLWTVPHGYSLPGLAKVFGFGLFLSWLLWRTGSLRLAIFCHALNNAISLLLILAIQRLVDLPAPQ